MYKPNLNMWRLNSRLYTLYYKELPVFFLSLHFLWAPLIHHQQCDHHNYQHNQRRIRIRRLSARQGIPRGNNHSKNHKDSQQILCYHQDYLKSLTQMHLRFSPPRSHGGHLYRHWDTINTRSGYALHNKSSRSLLTNMKGTGWIPQSWAWGF
jgi:hypothetical protein